MVGGGGALLGGVRRAVRRPGAAAWVWAGGGGEGGWGGWLLSHSSVRYRASRSRGTRAIRASFKS